MNSRIGSGTTGKCSCSSLRRGAQTLLGQTREPPRAEPLRKPRARRGDYLRGNA